MLLGPSGCGKSTILKMLSGLEQVSHGNINIGGADVTEVEASKRGVSMVFQSYALFPHLNVKENIQIVVENRGQIIPKKYRKRIFERFFRVDKSRSRSAGGTGLGLSIVKHILFVHNGSVNYSSLEDDINRFTLKIPF